jgi:hypothetical protein
MKSLWIMLGALACLGIVCSGGNCLIGAKLFRHSNHVSASAESYAQDAVNAILKDWDIKELQNRAADTYKGTASLPQALEFFKVAKAKLGSLKSPPVFTTKKIVEASDNKPPKMSDEDTGDSGSGGGSAGSSDTGAGPKSSNGSDSDQPAPQKVTFAGDAKFQKGTAGIVITIIESGEDWKVIDFQVKSPLFSRGVF